MGWTLGQPSVGQPGLAILTCTTDKPMIWICGMDIGATISGTARACHSHLHHGQTDVIIPDVLQDPEVLSPFTESLLGPKRSFNIPALALIRKKMTFGGFACGFSTPSAFGAPAAQTPAFGAAGAVAIQPFYFQTVPRSTSLTSLF